MVGLPVRRAEYLVFRGNETCINVNKLSSRNQCAKLATTLIVDNIMLIRHFDVGLISFHCLDNLFEGFILQCSLWKALKKKTGGYACSAC